MKLKYSAPLLLITLLCIGGVETFYHVLARQLAEDQPSSRPASVLQQQEAPRDVQRDPQQLDVQAITRRNLFSSQEGTITREEIDPLEGVEPSSLDVVLTGTITGLDERRRAIIYDKKDRKQELYQEGDLIRQAVIKKILRGKVIINADGKDEMLDISEARNLRLAQGPPVRPATVVQRPVSRPVGGGAPAPPQATGGELQQGAAGGTPVNPQQLRSFRGGITVKGRVSGQQ